MNFFYWEPTWVSQLSPHFLSSSLTVNQSQAKDMQKFEAWKENIFNFFPQHFCTRPIAQPTKKCFSKLEFHFNTEYFLTLWSRFNHPEVSRIPFNCLAEKSEWSWKYNFVENSGHNPVILRVLRLEVSAWIF